MHLARFSPILALSSFALLTHALPLNGQNHDRQQGKQRRAHFSVVDVDGGSAATSEVLPTTVVKTVTQSSDTTKTVTVPASTLPPSTQTVFSATIVSAPKPVTTVLVTVSQEPSSALLSASSPTVVAVNPAPTSESPAVPLGQRPEVGSSSEVSITQPANTSAISTATTSPSESTEMATSTTPFSIIESPTTTPTYDNGMWHTTYPSWNTSSTSTFMATLLPTASPTVIQNPAPTTLLYRRQAVASGSWPFASSLPALPKLPPTTARISDSAEIPSVVEAEGHMIPGVYRR
ncbi:hypothetical protein MMC24_001020 [Lignoscripta atroalba]|nr:hypothetical protein [Lignoscripta atroalba]